MPLQKPLPRRMIPTEQSPSNSRQVQGRRRSLHTISELSVTDDAAPGFSSFMGKPEQRQSQTHGPVAKRSSQDLGKRRSLPQYCPSTPCLQALAVSPPINSSSSGHVQPLRDVRSEKTNVDKEGWNAKRERARMQREQAVVASTYRQQPLTQTPPSRSYAAISRKPVQSPASAKLGPYSSHHQVLANSRSISGISSYSSNNSLDHRSSLGTMAGGHSDASTFDIGAPDRASTDSSSYQSIRDSAVRESRSISSSDASCPSPALPIVSARTQVRHHSMPSPYIHKEVAAETLPYTLPHRPVAGRRVSSLPSTRVDHVELGGQHKRHGTFPQHYHHHHQQHSDIQRARLESLAALTASPPPPPYHHHHHHHHHHHRPPFTHSHTTYSHPTTSHRTSVSSRPRPHSYHNSPPHPLSHPGGPTPQPAKRYYPKFDSHETGEKRTVPRRESLTQWKAERDEVSMEFYGVRRASMKERVRRANELEREREEELVRMGKGIGEKGECGGCEDDDDDDNNNNHNNNNVNNEEGEARCLSGILGMFRLGR